MYCEDAYLSNAVAFCRGVVRVGDAICDVDFCNNKKRVIIKYKTNIKEYNKW